MLKKTFKNKKLIITILLIAALYLFRTVLSWYMYTILDLNPKSSSVLEFGIWVKTLIWLPLAYFLLKWWYPKNWLETAGFKTFNWKTLFWTAIAIFIHISYLYFSEIFDPGTQHYKSNLTFSILLFEIRNSFIEESFFRGFLQPFLNDHLGFWKGIVIQGFLFSAIHWCWWVFAGELSFESAMYMWALGMFWGFIKQKSGSIYPTLVSHAIHNLVLTMLM